MKLQTSVTLLLCFAASSLWAGIYDQPSRRIQGSFTGYVYCKGLRSPDGLAIHPSTGELYVSEETEGRISVVRDHQRVTVVQNNFTVTGDIPRWAITRKKPESAWREQKIHSPEGIAFTAEGHLLVTEDVPNGRLLEFIPDDEGRFVEAIVHPIPWLDNDYAWEGITVAKDGRIFIAGSKENSGPGLFFGTVMMREPNGDWWAVDYGPFNSFSSVALSRDEDILVVGDSVTGSVNWWDTVRHSDIGASTGIVAEIEGVCVLPDGAILAAQESTGALQMNAFHKTAKMPAKGGKLVYLHPETGESKVVAAGFGTIESVLVHPQSGYVYVTEDSSGTIYELRPDQPWDTSRYALQRTVKTYESAKGLAPKNWPPFLKDFFGKMGVGTRNETVEQADESREFTLKEFAERVPLIAGRFQTEEIDGVVDPDPVVEVDFVSFFPGKTVKSETVATPSLSLFSARHKSGKVDKTRVLGDMNMFVRQSGDEKWATTGQQAYMLLPMVSCAAVNTEEGIDINMAFMGVGGSPDYFLQVPGGQVKKGVFYLEDEKLGKSRYEASFVQELKDGGEVHNLIVAGFEAPRDDRMNWYEIGTRPLSTLLSLDLNAKPKWLPRALRHSGAPLMALLEKRMKQEDPFAVGGIPNEQNAQQAQAEEEHYIPTVSLEHMKGSLELGDKEAESPAGGEHAHQAEPDSLESASTETPDGVESVSVEKPDGVESVSAETPDGVESVSAETPDEVESASAGTPAEADETAGFAREAPYWEVALYNRAVEAWTSLE